MGDYWTNSVRHPEDTGIGYVRRTLTFDMAAATTGLGLPIGAMEGGTMPLYVHVYIETAFNGTTPTLDIGTTDNASGFAASASVAPGTTGFKGNLSGALTGIPLAGHRVVYAKVGGTGATTGKATIVLTFANKREVEGIPFPAN
ncbi:hypothetical protein J2X36_002144 [Methylobacterium sp. BE186]|uniref:hypothetical protein n=1 Tax=Methylobacterium sp. BE186 TaxID=2817715 RepID=UPI002863FDFE|nr:hypothetical protein [Methylobacterium sp. BE186]MDR7037397.1 hypothetical protein [Methylobacterium sp. BE186]